MPTRWFYETLHPDVRQGFLARRVVAQRRTPFQRMQILETATYGRTLILDGVVQTTERDEHIYHEMMTHVPLLIHPRPRRVLIIGGGDGGIAREVLRHPTVEQVTMVEIDPDVIHFCRRHLPSISRGAFNDRRLRVLVDDGARYVRRTADRFDVAIVDSTDPIGPGTVLFQTEFYRNVARVLRPRGLLVRQAGSLMLQASELPEACRRLRRVFRVVRPYVAAIPTYIGGFFGFVLATNDLQPLRISEAQVEARYRRARLACRYYSPAIHRACFALPASVKASLAAA